MSDGAAPPIVRVRGIRKEFPGVVALDQVDLELRPGEVHALAGENGSGKSTLAKIVYGVLQPDAGTVEVDGAEVTISSPRRALELGIVAISQELTLAQTLSVAENVLMGRLPRRRGLVDWPAARSAARESLDQLGVHVDPDARVGDLRIELQQEIEIARAVSARSRVLILDEATSSLSEAATERLLAKLQQLRDRGVAVLFISHRLRELYACAQVATVLRDGRRVGTVSLPDTPEGQVVRMMVGREISDLYNKRDVAKGAPRLVVSGLTTADGAIDDVSFEVCGGEIVGVAGLLGSGKTTLALALAGAVPAEGTIRLDDKPLLLRSPRDALTAGVGFVPEDRKRSALFLTRTVRQNFVLGWLGRVSRLGVLNVLRERKLVEQAVRRFGVRTRSIDTPIVQLSGGNQQKVVLGRGFAAQPEVIVLAEPTRGIDVGAKSEVYRFIQDMAERGAGVLMISSELPELLGLADRILVMYRGKVRASFDARAATEETIAHVALSGEASA